MSATSLNGWTAARLDKLADNVLTLGSAVANMQTAVGELKDNLSEVNRTLEKQHEDEVEKLRDENEKLKAANHDLRGMPLRWATWLLVVVLIPTAIALLAVWASHGFH